MIQTLLSDDGHDALLQRFTILRDLVASEKQDDKYETAKAQSQTQFEYTLFQLCGNGRDTNCSWKRKTRKRYRCIL